MPHTTHSIYHKEAFVAFFAFGKLQQSLYSLTYAVSSSLTVTLTGFSWPKLMLLPTYIKLPTFPVESVTTLIEKFNKINETQKINKNQQQRRSSAKRSMFRTPVPSLPFLPHCLAKRQQCVTQCYATKIRVSQHSEALSSAPATPTFLLQFWQ